MSCECMFAMATTEEGYLVEGGARIREGRIREGRVHMVPGEEP